MYNKLEFTEEISIPIATTKQNEATATTISNNKKTTSSGFLPSESMNEWEKLAQEWLKLLL